jgi:4-hydroxybenzoate polyprenyltransferase
MATQGIHGQGGGGARVADRQLRWVDRLPAALRPYAVLARWDRPIGTWLLLFPCWWGVALAPGWPDLGLLALFALGAVAMRGAGCTINDLTDRDIDARVERTRNRPLASGALTVPDALGFLVVQLAVGLVVLLNLNRPAIALGFLAMPLVIAYPFMKRITYWPQAFLGITFNWGALVGWTAATGALGPPALLLYAAGFLWTLGYDTIYAHQDKEDDALVGVKSSALALGAASPGFIAVCYAGMVVLLAMAGAVAGMRAGFFLMLAAVALHLAWQVRRMRLDDPADCLRRFRSNRDLGLLVFVAILAGQIRL